MSLQGSGCVSVKECRLTYIIIEGTYRVPANGVDILYWSRRKAKNKIEFVCGASHQVEVVTHWDGGRPIRPLV